jgi:ABC-2 type transport system permease protein
MSYELLSGERERGTLAMLLSQPVRQTDLAVGKATARFTLVALATFVLASLGLLAAGVDFTVSGAALHASIYLATLLCWAGVWFAAAVWVNSRQGSSANNALSLVGAWLLVVVIVPGLVNLAVDTALPAPSSMELVHEAREAGLDIEKDLSVLKGRHDQDTTDANYKAKVAASEDLLTERLSPLMAQHREQQEHRAQVLNLLGFLSPAMLVQLSLEDIAGTSAYRQAQFASHVQGSPVSSADIKASAQQTAYSMEESTPPSLLLKRALPRLGFLLLLIALITRAAWPGLSRIGRLSN